MILTPEKQLEEGQRMVDLYIPTLEDLFEVELGEISLKPWDYLGEIIEEEYLQNHIPGGDDSALKRALWNVTGPIYHILAKNYRRCGMSILTSENENTLFGYDPVSNTILQGPKLKLVTEQELARGLVHELGHAVQEQIVDMDVRCPYSLQDIMREGFAEYVSLGLFRADYGIEGIDELLDSIVAEFHDDAAKLMDMENTVTLESNDFYSAGYLFFEFVDSAGIAPQEVLVNPPQAAKEIIFPGLYLKRMK